MDTFRQIVLAACIVGISDKIVSIVCGDRYMPQMRLITAMVMILSIGSHLSGGIELPDTSYYEQELEYAENRTSEDYLDCIEQSISNRVGEIYKNEGITLENISIAVSYDEYKYINVDEITLYTSDAQVTDKELKKVILPYFPDSEINIIR